VVFASDSSTQLKLADLEAKLEIISPEDLTVSVLCALCWSLLSFCDPGNVWLWFWVVLTLSPQIAASGGWLPERGQRPAVAVGVSSANSEQ
jgi:hypothetical protein